MINLNDNVKITRVMNAVVAGTSDQNGSAVDMEGFEGVMFVAMLGTLSANQVTELKAQQDTDSGMGSAQDLAGTKVGPMADDDDNQCLVLDVYRPRERYVRPVLLRETGNAVIDGIIAIQYGARKAPAADDATTVAASETHVSPAEGTA